MNINFGGRKFGADVRMLKELADVAYDGDFVESSDNVGIYYMFRDLYLDENDRDIIKSNGLRYDITIIPPMNLGREFVKTFGHYHPNANGTGEAYPELYQVLEGSAHYLLQKIENDEVADFVVVRAKKNDIVPIPPGYGHVTVNPSDKVLRMANWVSRNFPSIYETVREKRGFAYYELKDGFIKNGNYPNLPEIRFSGPVPTEKLGLAPGEDMYGLVENIGRLEFLNKPRLYKEAFEIP